MSYAVALDQGTTSSRAIVLNRDGPMSEELLTQLDSAGAR